VNPCPLRFPQAPPTPPCHALPFPFVIRTLTPPTSRHTVLADQHTNTVRQPVLISIEPSDARPIYVQIMDEIKRAIVLGTVTSHELLPSVRQLAAELRVNPNTVQQAYRELERDGRVYVRRGQGTFVAEDGADRQRERLELAAMVADRAIREAYRNGLSADELVAAIRRAETGAGVDTTDGGGA
jgi:GntR family transcriptional regulator